jgi:hypothetical protein
LARFDVQPIERFGGSLPGHFQFGIIVAFAHSKYGDRRITLWQGQKEKFPRGKIPDLKPLSVPWAPADGVASTADRLLNPAP